jgi:hypothetical protein
VEGVERWAVVSRGGVTVEQKTTDDLINDLRRLAVGGRVEGGCAVSGDTSVPSDVLDSLAVLVREHAPSCHMCGRALAVCRVALTHSGESWSVCDGHVASPRFECVACGCFDFDEPGGQCPLCSSTEPTVAAQVTITDLPHAAALRWARGRKVTT